MSHVSWKHSPLDHLGGWLSSIDVTCKQWPTSTGGPCPSARGRRVGHHRTPLPAPATLEGSSQLQIRVLISPLAILLDLNRRAGAATCCRASWFPPSSTLHPACSFSSSVSIPILMLGTAPLQSASSHSLSPLLLPTLPPLCVTPDHRHLRAPSPPLSSDLGDAPPFHSLLFRFSWHNLASSPFSLDSAGTISVVADLDWDDADNCEQKRRQASLSDNNRRTCSILSTQLLLVSRCLWAARKVFFGLSAWSQLRRRIEDDVAMCNGEVGLFVVGWVFQSRGFFCSYRWSTQVLRFPIPKRKKVMTFPFRFIADSGSKF
jgi:hypothetical protein